MTTNDPIADMLTRIRNALLAHHESVVIPSSNIKKSIAEILLDEGFIQGFKIDEKDGKAARMQNKRTVDNLRNIRILQLV